MPDLQCGGIQVDRLATTEYTHTTAWCFADADSDSVVVEVGVRSYIAAALLRVLDDGQDGCETSEEDKINDEVRHDPSREALRKHGWRVKAVKSLERELGGVKSMKSLDAAVAGKARNRT